MRLWSGVLYTRTFVPGGARGVRLKPKAPFSWASTESHGFNCDVRRRLSVRVA